MTMPGSEISGGGWMPASAASAGVVISNQQASCRWCGFFHGARCPQVAALEFSPDGTVKRVEFVAPQPMVSAAMGWDTLKKGPMA